MAAPSRLTGEAKLFLWALLRGCAQIAFCDSPMAGVLVLAGITLASPFSGLGTLLGALFGTIASRRMSAYRREEWAWGLAAFNPAITGLLWGGFFASGEVHPLLLVPVLALSMLLDRAFRHLLRPLMVPALSSGALVTVYLVSLMAAPPGGWFWTEAPANALVPFAFLGAGSIFVAMALKSPFAAVWALLLSAITFLAAWLADNDTRTLVGLWGIGVPLACFGVHAIFLRGSLAGCIAGTIAAALTSLIWVIWESSPLARWLPPLLSPFIFGAWLSIILMRKLMTVPLAHPGFWHVAYILAAARAAGREVAALIQGCGSGPGGPPSGFISGAWLDPQVPRSMFEREHLQTSSRCRQAFWDACDRLRNEVKHRASNLPLRVDRLQRDGWLQAVVIQDVRLPTEFAQLGAVVPLHGDVQRTQCLDCGAANPWPPMAVWRHCDVRCATCHGAVVPAITLFGAAIDNATASRLRELEARCAMVLALGDEASEPATLAFLDRARKAGATVAFISDGAPSYPRRPGDISVSEHMARFLGFLHFVLAGWPAFSGEWKRRSRAWHASPDPRSGKAAE